MGQSSRTDFGLIRSGWSLTRLTIQASVQNDAASRLKPWRPFLVLVRRGQQETTTQARSQRHLQSGCAISNQDGHRLFR